MPILLNKTIRLFLDSIGKREEYEFYLNRFQTDKSVAFAILCPDRPGFEDVAPMFTFDLHFLLRLELFPAVILCGEHTEEMRDMLFAEDHPYEECALHKLPGGCSSSEITADAVDFLKSCRSNGKIGVLLAPQMNPGDVLLNLVPEVARRIHFIRTRGPLRTDAEKVLFYHYTARPTDYTLDEPDQALAQQAASLLQARPGTHVSIASPWNLLQELFTVKGAGCVIRKGSIITRCQPVTALDRTRLEALLEESFRKNLVNEDWLSQVDCVYVEENYRGAAILEKHVAGMYLSKFAVGTQARGEGLANELWDEVVRGQPSLFWRARINNPINHWYEKQADGYHQTDKWKVFWRGIAGPDISEIIRYSLERRDDFS